MALSSKELALQKDYKKERAELTERIAFLNEVLALFHKQEALEPTREESPQLALHSTVEENEEEDPMTVRNSIRRYLRIDKTSKPAPEIAKALLAWGVFDDYKKGKDRVDTNLKRMRDRGEVERTDDGWQLAS